MEWNRLILFLRNQNIRYALHLHKGQLLLAGHLGASISQTGQDDNKGSLFDISHSFRDILSFYQLEGYN